VNFGLSEEQELLQETVRGFVAKECPAPRLRQIFDAGEGHDPALWKGLAEIGVAGLAIDEKYGGAGLEWLDLALAAEVLGAGALPGPFLGHSLAALAIGLAGSDEQRERWLPQLASGERIGTVAFGEAGDAWAGDEWALALDGGRLRGAKEAVPFGALADVIVAGVAGGGLVVVERGAAGLSVEDMGGVDRTRPIARLGFEGTPCQPLPGGAAAAPRVRDAGLALLAADALGGAWHLVEASAEYAKTREQFGQVIASFQAVKHKLADMAVEVEPARGLCWYAAHAFDRIPAEAERAAALAKAHLTDRFVAVARDAVEVHGGIGFTWECDVQIWFKRALFDRAFLGTPEVHRERAARLAGW
jgi:alkylation response protein AidB-like acyl-CoA dehydrogenase